MVKLLEDLTCPHCKKDFEKETDLDQLDKPEPVKANKSSVQQQTQLEQKEPEKQPPKEVIKEVVKLPNTIPGHKCKDGNCGRVHPNKNYSRAPKYTCQNCGQFSDNNEDCIWCNSKDFEEIEKEDLEDMGIRLPKQTEEDEHDHEDS